MTSPGGGGDRLEVQAVLDATGFARDAKAKIDAQVKALRAKIRADVDTARLQAQTQAAARRIEKTTRVQLKVGVDAKYLRESVKAALNAGLGAGGYRVKVGVDVDTSNVRTAVEAATAGGSRATVEVDADTTAARDAIRDVGDDAERTRPEVNVRVRATGLRETQRALAALGRIGLIAGAVQAVTTAVVGLGAGLVSIVGAASQAAGALAAIPSLFGIIAQGAGALFAGFSGVGDAVSAMGKAEAGAGAASAASAKAREGAARRIADAQKAVGKAQEQADRTAVNGAKAVAAARQRLADVQQRASSRVQSAEQANIAAQRAASTSLAQLTRARAEATDQLRDYQLQLSGSALDEEAAGLAIERARERLDEANRNPISTALDRKEADLALRQSLQNLDEIRTRNGDLQKEAAAAQAAGIDGSSAVLTAQERIAQADQDAREAAAELAAERVQSARDIADAEVDLADTVEETALSNRDALESVADAQQAVADAIADAADAASAGGGGIDALAQAMEKLSPAGQAFARFVNDTLKPRLQQLKFSVQEAMLPGIQEGVTRALPLLDTLEAGLVDTGSRLGDLAVKGGELLGSGLFREDVGTIMASNNRALTSFGNAGLSLVNVFKNLAVAAGPLVERFASFIESKAGVLDTFVTAQRESGKLGEFMERAGDRVAQLGRIVANLAVSLFNVGSAGADSGDRLLTKFEALTERMREFTASGEGQERLRQFFESMEPITEKLGTLFATLAETVIHLGENGGGSIGAFIDTLNFLLQAVNSLLASPFGPFISSLLTIAGTAGALAFVGSGLLGAANNIKTVATAATGAISGTSNFIAGLRGGAEAASTLGTNAANAGAKARAMASSIASGVAGLGGKIAGAATSVGSLAAEFGRSAIAAGRATAAYVANGIAAAATAIKNGVLTAATIVTTAAQTALNFVMSLNPFTLILIAIAALVAAFLYAFHNIDGFKEGVLSVLGTIRDFAVSVFEGVAGFFTDVWSRITGIFTSAVTTVSAFLAGAWNGIKTVATTVWGAITGFFSGVWEGIGGIFRGAVSFVQGLWSGFLNGLSTIASTIWSTITNAVSGFVSGFRSAFENVVSAVRSIWEGLREVFAAPIRFVVNTVYNNGIRRAWNAVTGLFNGPQLPSYQFAKGGVVPDGRVDARRGGVSPGYAPGVDSLWTLSSPGEGYVVPEAVRGLGRMLGTSGAGAINAINSAFSSRVAGPGLPGAGGGAVPAFAGGGVLSRVGSFVSDRVDDVRGFVAGAFTATVEAIVDPLRATAAAVLPKNGLGRTMLGLVNRGIDGVLQAVGAKDDAEARQEERREKAKPARGSGTHDRGGRVGQGVFTNYSGRDEGVLSDRGMRGLGGFGVLDSLNSGGSLVDTLQASRATSSEPRQSIGTMIAPGAVQLTVNNPVGQTSEGTLNERLRVLGAQGIFAASPAVG